jgi:hypothetical protein
VLDAAQAPEIVLLDYGGAGAGDRASRCGAHRGWQPFP